MDNFERPTLKLPFRTVTACLSAGGCFSSVFWSHVNRNVNLVLSSFSMKTFVRCPPHFKPSLFYLVCLLLFPHFSSFLSFFFFFSCFVSCQFDSFYIYFISIFLCLNPDLFTLEAFISCVSVSVSVSSMCTLFQSCWLFYFFVGFSVFSYCVISQLRRVMWRCQTICNERGQWGMSIWGSLLLTMYWYRHEIYIGPVRQQKSHFIYTDLDVSTEKYVDSRCRVHHGGTWPTAHWHESLTRSTLLRQQLLLTPPPTL